jgi:hypothetical protein
VLDTLDVLGKTGIKTEGIAAILDNAKKKELDRARVAAANAARRASGATATGNERQVAPRHRLPLRDSRERRSHTSPTR